MGKNLLESPFTSSKDAAKQDAMTLKRKGIKSPDLSKLIKYKVGKATYFFNTEEQKQKFIENQKN